MSAERPPNQRVTPDPRAVRGVRLRLLAAMVALAAGVAALTIVIVLVRSVLG